MDTHFELEIGPTHPFIEPITENYLLGGKSKGKSEILKILEAIIIYLF